MIKNPSIGYYSIEGFFMSLLKLNEWLFGTEQNKSNLFFDSVFRDSYLMSEENIRNENDIDKIDTLFLAKNYDATTQKQRDILKADVRTEFLNKKYSSRRIDWFIVKPIGLFGSSTYRSFCAVYVPNTETIKELKLFLCDLTKACFSFNFVSVIDMTDGTEEIVYVGNLRQPEPKCKEGFRHKWDWDCYNEDGVENFTATCIHCGLKKSLVTGDNRNYKWNEAHSWRYHKDIIVNKHRS